MIGDAGEDVAQVGLGIEPVELRALDQAVEGGRALGAAVRAGEEVVLAPDRDAAQRTLGRVVVERELPTVVEGAGERWPARQHVVEGAGQLGTAGELRKDRLGPGLQRLRQRS